MSGQTREPIDLPRVLARLRASLDLTTTPAMDDGIVVSRADLETLLAAVEYVQTAVPVMVDLTTRCLGPLLSTFRQVTATLGIDIPTAGPIPKGGKK